MGKGGYSSPAQGSQPNPYATTQILQSNSFHELAVDRPDPRWKASLQAQQEMANLGYSLTDRRPGNGKSQNLKILRIIKKNNFLCLLTFHEQNGILSENRKIFSWKMQTCQVKLRLEEQKRKWEFIYIFTKIKPKDNVLITTLHHKSTLRASLAQKCHPIMTHIFGLTWLVMEQKSPSVQSYLCILYTYKSGRHFRRRYCCRAQWAMLELNVRLR